MGTFNDGMLAFYEDVKNQGLLQDTLVIVFSEFGRRINENSNGANGLTFDHQGRLLACEKGRVTRTEKDGKITTLAEKGLNVPNDLVYSIDGSIYFSDLAPRGATGGPIGYSLGLPGPVDINRANSSRAVGDS